MLAVIERVLDEHRSGDRVDRRHHAGDMEALDAELDELGTTEPFERGCGKVGHDVFGTVGNRCQPQVDTRDRGRGPHDVGNRKIRTGAREQYSHPPAIAAQARDDRSDERSDRAGGVQGLGIVRHNGCSTERTHRVRPDHADVAPVASRL